MFARLFHSVRGRGFTVSFSQLRWLLLGLYFFGLMTGSGCSDDDDKDTAVTTTTAELEAEPGRVTLHRLNRAEYNNTIRDLLGTDLRPAEDFPMDDFGYGFDNIAEVLTVSPLLVELYAYTAEKLVEEALFQNMTEPQLWHLEAEVAQTTTGGAASVGWNLWSNGELYNIIDVPLDGRYKISARVYGQQAGPDLAQASLMLDGVVLQSFAVEAASADAMEVIEVEAELAQGMRQVSLSFDNDFYEPEEGLDRNLIVDWLRLEGPLNLDPEENPKRIKMLACEGQTAGSDACAVSIFERFARRAFRRPILDEELTGLKSFVELAQSLGDSWETGIRLGLEKILTSPHFMYRVEYETDPTSTAAQLLTSWELASRLSYFLWSSMPDDELFEHAQDGSLLNPTVLASQVTRMLEDPKAEALVSNFAGQWLHIRAIEDAAPDAWYFPDFDEQLRESMRGEMEHFVRSLFFEDRSLLDLLKAENGWVDSRLAQHYGMSDFEGTGFQEVWLSPYQRGGLLTQAGWLMARSYPTRTSPVKRGKWVLEHLLCSPPAPPPPGVEGLEEAEDSGGSIREQLERHGSEPVCATCHVFMDPLGFGLEHFDGIGAHREFDGDYPVNAADVLPDGTAFDGATELQAVLAADERVPSCMVEKFFIYATGRGVKPSDRFYLESIEEAFTGSGHRLEPLVQALVKTDAFTMRGGDLP